MTWSGKIICAAILLLAAPTQARIALPSFADLVDELSPSVVNISTTQKPDDLENEDTSLLMNNVSPPDFSTSENPQHTALGSGFLIDTQGYILTNNHVIDNASDISVILFDNTALAAKVIGTDSKTDLALIKIETTKPLKPIKFGDSDQIRVGDWILAIGNPFGLGGSVTAGIVSAKSRDIDAGSYDNFIQTDAAINQGSSGGPMFNLDGEVIGVNTAIFSTTGGSQGIGFAIPSNLTHFVVEQLKAQGQVKRGWIGVKIQPASIDITKSLGLIEHQGVIISSVNEGSSAKKSGLEAGDVILEFAGQKIDTPKNFSRMVAESTIGQSVDLRLWHNKQARNLKIMIEEMPPEPLPIKTLPQNTEEAPEIIEKSPLQSSGLEISNINEQMLDKFHLDPSARGVVITTIIPGSEAEAKGLRPGDIIRQLDKKEVFSLEDLKNHLADAIMEDYRPVLLSVQTGENIHFVALKIKEE